ncbi:MAG: cupin domain-containing protein [Candidatus Latescibacterota bacterium]|jgi:mannose-6-phosphate isomerase-like protein (cupin superfamily)
MRVNKSGMLFFLFLTVAMIFAAAGIAQNSSSNKLAGIAAKVGATETQNRPVFGRTDPAKFNEAPKAHGGAGMLKYMELLGGDTFKSNILFAHRGVIPSHSGIGEHIHRNMEEMFFIFDGRAQFTVNGHTAELPGRSMVLCSAGSSHGIYNDTDKDIQWMNVGVGMVKGKYDNIDYGDDLSNAVVESPAPFLWGNLDRILLNPVAKAHDGAGTLLFRRIWSKSTFKTPWYFVDHCLLPPGTSIGYHQHNSIEEIYYIVEGSGLSTVNGYTFAVKAGDAIPCTVTDSHGIYNDSQANLEVMVVCAQYPQATDTDHNWGDDLSKRKITKDTPIMK